jgi:hypothetical protein
LIDDSHLEVVLDAHLARETDVFCKPCLHCEAVALGFAYFARVARENFHAAGRAFGVAATAMQYIYASVFDGEDEFAPLVCVKSL